MLNFQIFWLHPFTTLMFFCHLNVEIEFYFFADFDDRILKQQEEEEERKRQRREKKKEKV
jgi:U4/U6.U5 tri-snRNP component SNU23